MRSCWACLWLFTGSREARRRIAKHRIHWANQDEESLQELYKKKNGNAETLRKGPSDARALSVPVPGSSTWLSQTHTAVPRQEKPSTADIRDESGASAKTTTASPVLPALHHEPSHRRTVEATVRRQQTGPKCSHMAGAWRTAEHGCSLVKSQ